MLAALCIAAFSVIPGAHGQDAGDSARAAEQAARALVVTLNSDDLARVEELLDFEHLAKSIAKV